VFFRLYPREHLDQVLATFGLILFFNELVIMLWGPSALSMDVPAGLRHTVQLFGFAYPAYRFAIIGVGLAVGVGLYVLIHRTAVGIRIRAAASNSAMASALGINVKRLNTQVVCLGAGLAALAGLMAGPITAVQSGMGEPILIMALVVIVTGGVGSVRGAFYGALVVGVIDTLGRSLLPLMLRGVLEQPLAHVVGPAIASIMIYLVMAMVLVVRPGGLFPVRHG
jgi:branched-chain amino acid transport system permease protein